ncbi:patatin-like phospholipase family protein [Pleurocapsa sp. PCC 7319]|uniref:patatin-like phospholipase family protein n=1 Tax=Pleurocapsa sp. PCC 7319 TaxID=118161 RepID=UPI000348B705|nr:patatin-like phospholipase family protein [Pleurocapsa sp. PCC 7319]
MNYHQNPQIGLVLAGGGAKGAYQAGALRYLAEIGLQPQIIAGTSIGALNGATLAANTPFNYAVQRLDRIWTKLGQTKVISPHQNLAVNTLNQAAKAFVPTFRHWLVEFALNAGLSNNKALLDPEPIETMLKEIIAPDALRNGIELWVTVFPSLKIPGLDYDWLIDLIRSQIGAKAQWLRVQDCQNDETLFNLLLASAAIPFAFPQREVNGQYYVDGALGDNIPLGALAARGCTHAIVIHLDGGAIWNRHDFPEQTVIEIRPSDKINSSHLPVIGEIHSLLDFTPEKIATLKQMGYQDARSSLEPILETLVTVKQQRKVEKSLLYSTEILLGDEPL